MKVIYSFLMNSMRAAAAAAANAVPNYLSNRLKEIKRNYYRCRSGLLCVCVCVYLRAVEWPTSVVYEFATNLFLSYQFILRLSAGHRSLISYLLNDSNFCCRSFNGRCPPRRKSHTINTAKSINDMLYRINFRPKECWKNRIKYI